MFSISDMVFASGTRKVLIHILRFGINSAACFNFAKATPTNRHLPTIRQPKRPPHKET